MSNAIVQIPPDSTGSKIDTESLTVGANTVLRQRIQIAGSAATEVAPVSATNGLTTDPVDKALRDMGKIDVALLDQYTPIDTDSGAGTANALPVSWRKTASGGAEFGTSSDPVRTDPTGTTTQPVSAASLPLPTGAAIASKQPALGTAGASAADVLSVQGIASGTALPVSGTVSVNALPTGSNTIGKVDVLTINSQAPAFNTGARGATVQRVTIATDDVVPASQNGTWTVQPGNTANTTPWLTSEQAATAGGATPAKLISAATTNATSVKASAGQVYMITASNVNAAVRYLKFYNKASAPTVGTDVPVLVFAIPGNTAGAGTNIPVPDCGLVFSTGIAFAITTGVTDADTGAVALNEIVINYGWK